MMIFFTQDDTLTNSLYWNHLFKQLFNILLDKERARKQT